MQKILINWKTSSAGFLLILGAIVTVVYSYNEHGRMPDQTTMMAQLTAIFSGIGLLLSRDVDKSTEETNGRKDLEDLGERINNP